MANHIPSRVPDTLHHGTLYSSSISEKDAKKGFEPLKIPKAVPRTTQTLGGLMYIHDELWAPLGGSLGMRVRLWVWGWLHVPRYYHLWAPSPISAARLCSCFLQISSIVNTNYTSTIKATNPTKNGANSSAKTGPQRPRALRCGPSG